jgi:L-fucose isomerase-like protein
MIKIHLITFSSVLQKQISIYKMHETMLSELEKFFTIEIVDYKELYTLAEDDFKLVFIATGGTEKYFVRNFEFLPQPVIMLTNGMQNSLSASLEISYWLQCKGLKSEILHGDIKTIVHRIQIHYNNFEAQKAIRGKKIGVIGTPCSWLIASSVDYLLTKRRWGIEFLNIPIENVTNRYDLISEDEVGEQAAIIAGKALACREATAEDMIKAMRVYKAIKQICEKEKLVAITLNCYKLINLLGTTGCLALSLLNDEGILAGCEGDLQSIFTFLAINAVTGRTPFMANPIQISLKSNEMVFAHCSVSTKLTEQFIIRSHFESNTGVSIQGILPAGDVTIVKCGGECLDEYYVTSGRLLENTNYINVCRTQIRVKLDGPVDYFLRNPIGNHHMIILGNYEKQLDAFFASNNCKRIE